MIALLPKVRWMLELAAMAMLPPAMSVTLIVAGKHLATRFPLIAPSAPAGWR